MIGLIASLLAGVVLKRWVFALAVFPYFLRLRGRNTSLVAFYVYVLILVLSLPGESLYTHSGILMAVSTASSVFLLLDDVLRGVNITRLSLILSGVLLASAVYDYAFVLAMLGVVFYTSYLHFGRASYYLLGWMVSSAVLLYAFRGALQDSVMQSFVLIGLSVVFLLLAERSDVKFLEVGLREEE